MPSQTHVLTFGCARTQRTYRALLPGPAPDPRVGRLAVIPSCPGCGEEHSVLDTFGRPFRPSDEIDVSLAGFVPTPVTESIAVPPRSPAGWSGGHDRGRMKVPDDALLAAIPTDQKALAADIARALGFTLTYSLVERIDRLNARALSAWGQPLVQVIRTDTGRCPTYLQRIVTPEVPSTP